ncbi:MAG TPA: response regulator transcription factor [Armatimonadota bacterium]|jgi:DNA-binding NarL/FixJ family response regulator
MERIRVLIAEDQRGLRENLVVSLGLQPDMEVVAQAGDGEQALKLARYQKPDVMLTDLGMPVMDGIEATRRVRQELSATAVVVLTVFDDDERLFSALKAGALGYILKDATIEEVAEAIRGVHRGEGILHPPLVGRVMAEFARVSHALQRHRDALAELTHREVEILELLGQGRRNREIAGRLFITERTVKNHVSAILSKLEVNSRTEAALLANRYGLAPQDRGDGR